MIGEQFHAHIEACAQCRERPFDLCATGRALIEDVGQLPVITVLSDGRAINLTGLTPTAAVDRLLALGVQQSDIDRTLLFCRKT